MAGAAAARNLRVSSSRESARALNLLRSAPGLVPGYWSMSVVMAGAVAVDRQGNSGEHRLREPLGFCKLLAITVEALFDIVIAAAQHYSSCWAVTVVRR